MVEVKAQLHKGHRQRLKDKVRKNGAHSLSAHEVLELLLTYTIPYKDTNELAHTLINRYGSIAGVLSADYADLIKVSGVGEETALFLTMLPDVFEIFKKQKSEGKISSLTTVANCVKYFRENFEVKQKESLIILCLNNMFKVVKTVKYEGENDVSVNFDLKKISADINDSNVSSIVVMHTHPKGEAIPSNDDVVATKNLIYMCFVLGIKVQDHIIFNENNHFSFGVNGILQKLLDDCKRAFSDKDISVGSVAQNSRFKYDDFAE